MLWIPSVFQSCLFAYGGVWLLDFDVRVCQVMKINLQVTDFIYSRYTHLFFLKYYFVWGKIQFTLFSVVTYFMHTKEFQKSLDLIYSFYLSIDSWLYYIYIYMVPICCSILTLFYPTRLNLILSKTIWNRLLVLVFLNTSFERFDKTKVSACK